MRKTGQDRPEKGVSEKFPFDHNGERTERENETGNEKCFEQAHVIGHENGRSFQSRQVVESFDFHLSAHLFDEAKGLVSPLVEVLAGKHSILNVPPCADHDLNKTGVITPGGPKGWGAWTGSPIPTLRENLSGKLLRFRLKRGGAHGGSLSEKEPMGSRMEEPVWCVNGWGRVSDDGSFVRKEKIEQESGRPENKNMKSHRKIRT